MTTLVRRYRFGGRIARTLAVARVEILHLIHDRTTISLILLVPAIQIVLFGYAVNLDPRHVPIAVAGDRRWPSGPGRRVIGETGYFMIVADGLQSGAAERMVVPRARHLSGSSCRRSRGFRSRCASRRAQGRRRCDRSGSRASSSCSA